MIDDESGQGEGIDIKHERNRKIILVRCTKRQLSSGISVANTNVLKVTDNILSLFY